MERWEYQVVHLNVEGGASPPPSPPAPRPEPAADAAARPEAVFSKEYLEKEFPGFYGPQPAGAGQAQEQHPAHQLRGFLNLQGRDGWLLVGFYPVGQLLMMIFRRPLHTARSADAAGRSGSAAAASPATASPGTVSSGTASPASTAPPAGTEALEPSPLPPATAGTDPQNAALERIVARLEALERRLASGSAAAEAATPAVSAASSRAAVLGLDGLQDGEILPPERCRSFADEPRLSTAEAARALGFRSPASLLNLAARSGYRPGLIKRGANGWLAIYVGSERNGRGGRDRRLWVVLAP